MKIMGLVLSALVLAACCSAEDIPAQLKTMQTQIDKLSQAMAQQTQTIGEQKKQIEDQRKELEALRQAAPASGPMIDDILKKFDILEDKLDERTGQAIKIASRKKPGDVNVAF